MKFVKFFVLAFCFVLSAGPAFGGYTVIKGGTVINTHQKSVINNCIILIKDSVIIDIGEKIREKIPADAEVIDASGKFIIPGMTDGHIHFFQSGSLYTRPDGLDLRHRYPYEKELNWIRNNIDDIFKRYLRCGITSIIDLGGPMWNFDIKKKAQDCDTCPRVYTTGPLIASYQPQALTTDDPPIVKVNSTEEAVGLLDKEVTAGADLTKIWYVISKAASSGLEQFYPIVKSLVDESKRLGKTVWVHATELETARKSVEAGCNILAHNITDTEVDEAFLKLCKEKNIIVVPTMWVFESYESVYSKKLDLLPSEHLLGNPKIIASYFDMNELSYDELGDRQKKLLVENKPVVTKPVLLTNLKKLYDYGIPIAAGTDAGNVGVLHGPALFHEFTLMSKAGMSNHDILISATYNGAKLVNRQDRLGSLEKGKLADIVILNSNPLEDIQNTSDIGLVFKNGVRLEPEKLLTSSPADPVQIQLNAYNSKDLEAFLSVYDKDVEVYTFPDSLQYKGIDKMRELYRSFFAKAGNLYCKLVDRMTKDNIVIDRELVRTGIPGRETLNAIAVYEVQNGLIKKIWFIQ